MTGGTTTSTRADAHAEGPEQKGKRRLSVLVTFAIATTFAVLATVAGATSIAEAFELDGDPQAEAAPGDDWATLVAGNGTTGNGITFVAKTLDPDTGTFPIVDGDDNPLDLTYFSGGGSKDEYDINEFRKNGTPVANWLYDDGDVAPDKDEIINAFAAAYRVPDTTGDPDNLEDLVINFGLDRFSNDGDSALGFWFFKNRVTLDPDSSKFVGRHAIGDILVVTDAAGGTSPGDVTEIRVFQWTANGLSEITLAEDAVFDCQNSAHDARVCGTQNHDDGVDVPWAYQAKANNGQPANKYPHHNFYEGGVNINALIPGADQCFASFLAETRSATSTTAQLKDFALGDFPVCAPGTDLTASPTVAAPEVVVGGDSVTFTFSESNDGNVPLSNVHVDTPDPRCVAGATAAVPKAIPAVLDGGFNIGDANDDGKLDLTETFQFSCVVTTSSATAEVIEISAVGHGTDPAGRDTTVCAAGTPPANTFCDNEESATGKAVVILPGTELGVTRSPATIKAGDTVTFTITEKNDGVAPTGFDSYLALSSVSVDSAPAAGTATSVATDCDAELGTPTIKSVNNDNLLDAGETWTYVCTVTAPADDFGLVFTGSGTVLAGTSHARIVTTSDSCVNSSGTSTTAGVWCDSEEQASAGSTVISPSTQLTVTADALITYTIKENNNSGDAPLTPPDPASRESILNLPAGMCNDTAVSYVSGDTGDDKILGVGEEWVFTCKGTLAGPTGDTGSTSRTDHAIGEGHDSTGDNVTYCPGSTTPDDTYCDDDERDGVTVTIENKARGEDPPPPPT